MPGKHLRRECEDPWKKLALAVLVRAYRDNGRQSTNADVQEFIAGNWYDVVCRVAGQEPVRMPGVRLERWRVERV